MKRVIMLLLGLVVSGSGALAEIQTVKQVDLTKYAGTWYEIARNPIIVEPVCACARQVLTPTTDGRVSVYNSCDKYQVGGKLSEIRGTAIPKDATNAKLSVDFGFPWKGDYWIIALDESYRYAVVTDRFGYSLYILSQTPSLESSLFDEAVKKAQTQVGINRLMPTIQLGCTYPKAE